MTGKLSGELPVTGGDSRLVASSAVSLPCSPGPGTLPIPPLPHPFLPLRSSLGARMRMMTRVLTPTQS